MFATSSVAGELVFLLDEFEATEANAVPFRDGVAALIARVEVVAPEYGPVLETVVQAVWPGAFAIQP